MKWAMVAALLRTEADLERALDAVCAADARLAAVRAKVPAVPLRSQPAGITGLLRIVAGQQLSTASAAAVWGRTLDVLADPGGTLSAAAILRAEDATMRAAGLSRQKIATFRRVAEHVDAGLDLVALAQADAEEARRALEAIPGVGRWTADLTLMFCAGHPDILPVGDLAVRRAAQRALSLAEEPLPAELDAIGAAWSPHRSAVARLLWSYYRIAEAEARAKPAPAPAAAPAGYPF